MSEPSHPTCDPMNETDRDCQANWQEYRRAYSEWMNSSSGGSRMSRRSKRSNRSKRSKSKRSTRKRR